MANESKPTRNAERIAAKAKSRSGRSRAGSPCSVLSTGSPSKADRSLLTSVAKLRKELVCHTLSYPRLFVSFRILGHHVIFLTHCAIG